MEKQSQKLTLSNKDLLDIERIKPLLLEKKSELEIGVAIGLRRETISRKISKWVQTPDFRLWVKTAYVNKLGKVDDAEALKSLTRLMIEVLRQEQGIQPTENAPLAIRWMNDEEWKNKLSSNTAPIVGKENFIKALQGSDACHVEEDGEKPVAEPTNSSS
jgi:hypothetical protein